MLNLSLWCRQEIKQTPIAKDWNAQKIEPHSLRVCVHVHVWCAHVSVYVSVRKHIMGLPVCTHECVHACLCERVAY